MQLNMIGSTAMWRAVVANVEGDDETVIEASSVTNTSLETGSEHTKSKKRRIASLYESSDDDDSDDEFARAFLDGDSKGGEKNYR